MKKGKGRLGESWELIWCQSVNFMVKKSAQN
jgi:hypothetical protein